MAVTYSSTSAPVYSASGGASVAPTYPANGATGDLFVLVVGQKPSTANSGTVTTPSGWSLAGSITAAGGYGTTLGADTGNTNLQVLYRVSNGTETSGGAVTVTLGTNNISWATISRFTNATGGWGLALTTGEDSSAGSVSAALTSNPGISSGDVLLAAMCIPTDVTTPAQFTGQAVTATGATFGTFTEIREPDSSTGNDIGGWLAYGSCTAGTATAAPTVTATASGTTTNVRGPIMVLRVRESAAPTPDPAGFPATFTATDGQLWNTTNWGNGAETSGATATVLNNTGKLDPGTGTGYTGRVSRVVSGAAAGDVSFTGRFQYVSGQESYPRFYIRADTQINNANGYYLEPGYTAVVPSIEKVVSGTPSTLGTLTGWSALASNTWYRYRFEAEGATVRARLWLDGNSEPTSWDGSFTDSSLATGVTGITVGGGNAANQYFLVDDVDHGVPSSGTSHTGSVSGTQSMTGTVDGSVARLGAVTGTQSMTGAVSGAAGRYATVNATQSMTGAVTSSVGVTSSATSTQSMTGAVSAVSGVTGVVDGANTQTGVVSGTRGAVTAVSGTQSMSGVVDGVVGRVGSASRTQSMTGVVTGQVDRSAAVTGTQSVTGVATGVVWVSGAVAGAQSMSGVVAGARGVTAIVAGAQSMTGVVDGFVTTSGTGVNATQSLTGVIAGVVAANGSVTGTQSMAGAVSGVRGAVGSVSGTQLMTGVVDGSVARLGAVTGTQSVPGVVTASVGVSTGVAATQSMTSVVTGVVNRVSSVSGTQSITGVVTADGGPEGSVSGARSMTGTIAASVGVTSAAAGTRTITGVVSGVRGVTGAVTGAQSLTGVIDGTRGTAGGVTGAQSTTGLVTALVSRANRASSMTGGRRGGVRLVSGIRSGGNATIRKQKIGAVNGS